jgi:hypothetical protein
LTVTRPPPTLSLQAQPRREELTPTTAKQEFLERVKTLRLRESGNLHKAQARYKRNFDQHVKENNIDLKEGGDSYVKVAVTDTGRNHRLESLLKRPYKVLETAGHTFRLQIGDEQVRVTSDRVARAPSGEPDSSADPQAVTPPSQDTPTTTSRANTIFSPGANVQRKLFVSHFRNRNQTRNENMSSNAFLTHREMMWVSRSIA